MLTRHSLYDAARYRTYQLTEHTLAYTGQPVQLSDIDRPVWTLYRQEWYGHPARKYRGWAWNSVVFDGRHDDPSCFELSILCSGRLCGLAFGCGEENTYCSIDYIEGCPDTAHPLKGLITDIAVQTLIVYGALLGRPEVRISQPNPRLCQRVLAAGYGFQLVSRPGQAQYLSLPV